MIFCLISKIRKKKEESNKPKGEGNNYKFLSWTGTPINSCNLNIWVKERLLRFPINSSNLHNSNNNSHPEWVVVVDTLLRCIQDHCQATTISNNTSISSKLTFPMSRRAWATKKVTMKMIKSTWIKSPTTHSLSKHTIPSSAEILRHLLNST